MKTRKLIYPLLFMFASCATPEARFSQMSPAEIMVYNRTVEYLDQVYCSERVGIGSHIRRTECLTFREMAEGKVGTLDTPSSSSSVIQ